MYSVQNCIKLSFIVVTQLVFYLNSNAINLSICEPADSSRLRHRNNREISIGSNSAGKYQVTINSKTIENVEKLGNGFYCLKNSSGKYTAIVYCADIGEILSDIVVPDEISEIEEMCFLNNHDIVNVRFQIRSEISYIKPFAFEGCKNLKQVNIRGFISSVRFVFNGVDIVPPPVTIDVGCFFGCDSLSEIIINGNMISRGAILPKQIDSCESRYRKIKGESSNTISYLRYWNSHDKLRSGHQHK